MSADDRERRVDEAARFVLGVLTTQHTGQQPAGDELAPGLRAWLEDVAPGEDGPLVVMRGAMQVASALIVWASHETGRPADEILPYIGRLLADDDVR